MSIWQLIHTGGITMIVLLLCSIVSIAVIIERCIYFRKRSSIKRKAFMAKIKPLVVKADVQRALEVCNLANTPYSIMVAAGLSFWGHDEKEISNNMEREMVVETMNLEKFTSIVGTIGSVAVYIGLFGTVLGIIRAFHDISASGAGGISVVISGISEALACTAAGLSVAVPAVIAYNYFTKKIDAFISDMELCASEIMDLVAIRKK